jgi:hypothetical protein
MLGTDLLNGMQKSSSLNDSDIDSNYGDILYWLNNLNIKSAARDLAL